MTVTNIQLIFGFLFIFNTSIAAQDSLSIQEKPKYNLSEFINESGSFLIQPVKWDAYDWIKIGAISVITFSIIQVDENIRSTAIKNPKYSKSVPMEIGKQWGGFFVIPITVVTLLTIGTLGDHRTTKKLGFEIAQAALYSEAISFASKGCIGRSRPITDRGAFDYKPFTFFDSPQNSFPAGHVDAAFALSTVLSKNAGTGLLKIVAYIPAALAAASRIYQDEHWASDVFFGGCIGFFVGSWVVNLHEEKKSRVELSSVYPLTVKVNLD